MKFNPLRKPAMVAVTTTFVASMFAASTGYAAQCTNDVWNKVMSRGKLVVGVKADYKPWGFRDSSGAIVGMEIDMAKDVADKMGVELELVAVQSSNRMQFLEQGSNITTLNKRINGGNKKKNNNQKTTYVKQTKKGKQK